MIRFLHTSDLHLGKRFGNFPEDLRGRLREARHGVIARLAEAARLNGADVILLAGDTFDTETPSKEVFRQALAEMARHSSLRWVILPGNHDSLQAAPLWGDLQRDAPDNLLLAIREGPIDLSPGAFLLPAPCTVRRPGRDVTAWMDNASVPGGAIRIGLAHGAIQDFSEEGNSKEVIAPDRAIRAGLDYLALGDWHGAIEVGARTCYSGTPEPDRYKHDRPGQAFVVSIEAARALPEIKPVITGSFLWKTVGLNVLPDDDCATLLLQELPGAQERRQSLIRIRATGRLNLEGRAKLIEAVENVQPEFAELVLDDSELQIECAEEDLDLIDGSGALRAAADNLLSASMQVEESESERQVARTALARLFYYSQQVGG